MAFAEKTESNNIYQRYFLCYIKRAPVVVVHMRNDICIAFNVLSFIVSIRYMRKVFSPNRHNAQIYPSIRHMLLRWNATSACILQ